MEGFGAIILVIGVALLIGRWLKDRQQPTPDDGVVKCFQCDNCRGVTYNQVPFKIAGKEDKYLFCTKSCRDDFEKNKCLGCSCTKPCTCSTRTCECGTMKSWFIIQFGATTKYDYSTNNYYNLRSANFTIWCAQCEVIFHTNDNDLIVKVIEDALTMEIGQRWARGKRLCINNLNPKNALDKSGVAFEVGKDKEDRKIAEGGADA